MEEFEKCPDAGEWAGSRCLIGQEMIMWYGMKSRASTREIFFFLVEMRFP